jgi:hypothetical protein
MPSIQVHPSRLLKIDEKLHQILTGDGEILAMKEQNDQKRDRLTF